MISASSIDFSRITSGQFEELNFKLIRILNFEKVRWRQGSADDGRDIQALKLITDNLVGIYEEKWFFEAKHYVGGVPPVEFESKFAWANAEKPQHLVFILSSHITNSGDNWFQKRIQGLPYHVHLIQGVELKEILIKFPSLLREFSLINGEFNLIDLTLNDWIILKVLPSWNKVVLTLANSNINLFSKNEKLLLATFMIIHNSLNHDFGVDDEEIFMDHLHPIIEIAGDEYITDEDGDIEITEDVWRNIEWIHQKNYGSLEISDSEDELWRFGLVNIIKYQDESGILCILTKWENSAQVVKMLFISQDSDLRVVRFKTIKENVEDFITMYIGKRPAEPEQESFDEFWDGVGIHE